MSASSPIQLALPTGPTASPEELAAALGAHLQGRLPKGYGQQRSRHPCLLVVMHAAQQLGDTSLALSLLQAAAGVLCGAWAVLAAQAAPNAARGPHADPCPP